MPGGVGIIRQGKKSGVGLTPGNLPHVWTAMWPSKKLRPGESLTGPDGRAMRVEEFGRRDRGA